MMFDISHVTSQAGFVTVTKRHLFTQIVLKLETNAQHKSYPAFKSNLTTNAVFGYGVEE